MVEQVEEQYAMVVVGELVQDEKVRSLGRGCWVCYYALLPMSVVRVAVVLVDGVLLLCRTLSLLLRHGLDEVVVGVLYDLYIVKLG